MSWQWLDSRTIRHSDGHTIELKSGNWKVPMDIDPRFLPKTDSVTSARLIRTGLDFAASTTLDSSKTIRRWKNSADDNHTVNAAKPHHRVRPVLTLNKEKTTG